MALGLAALYLMNPNLTEADKKSLVRLNNISPENLEAKAKAQGLWHSKDDGISPGDLAVFSIKNSCLPHVGVVTGVDSKKGTVKVRCENRAASKVIDEELTIGTSDVRGLISKTGKGTIGKLSCAAEALWNHELTFHQHFESLVKNLLEPPKTE